MPLFVYKTKNQRKWNGVDNVERANNKIKSGDNLQNRFAFILTEEH